MIAFRLCDHITWPGTCTAAGLGRGSWANNSPVKSREATKNFAGEGCCWIASNSNMSKKDRACALLREGRSPSQIARTMQVRPSDVMNYLCLGIGEGGLRRSDV